MSDSGAQQQQQQSRETLPERAAVAVEKLSTATAQVDEMKLPAESKVRGRVAECGVPAGGRAAPPPRAGRPSGGCLGLRAPDSTSWCTRGCESVRASPCTHSRANTNTNTLKGSHRLRAHPRHRPRHQAEDDKATRVVDSLLRVSWEGVGGGERGGGQAGRLA